MHILVTGAAGFIGSHLAQRLKRLGHHVTGVDSFSGYYSRNLKELNADDLRADGVEVIEADLASDPVEPLLEGVDVVYHAAAQPGISATTPFDAYLRNNVIATHRLAEAARQTASLRLFVNVATSSIYGRHATGPETTEPKPTSYYGVTKLAAEQLVLAFHRDGGFPACSLRLFSVYGPRERPEKLYHRLIRCILENEPFPLYEGSLAHSRSFTYIGDVIAGFVAVLDHKDACLGEIINIGTDIEITTERGIRIVEEILDKNAKLAIQPKRAGDQLRTHADIGKARRLLGYAPQTPPETGLRHEVEWYKEKIFGKTNM